MAHGYEDAEASGVNYIYLDNAASSWPKPPEVARAVADTITRLGANPGRGTHAMAMQASRILFETRQNLARLCGIKNPNDIHFTLNTSMGLNMAIKGFLKPGDHVVSTAVEHNSVRRPLEYMRKKHGIDTDYVDVNLEGEVDLKQLRNLIRPQTKLIVCNHSSNLHGGLLPIEDIAEIARAKGVKILLDAAQTIGTFPIDVTAAGIDMMAFPGHKGLMGPQGTGGLYIAPDIDLEPILHGGTGSQSSNMDQPDVRPDRYETGTPNTPGIAGLNEGVKFVLEKTPQKIHERLWQLTQRMMEGLSGIASLRILGPQLGMNKTAIVSFVMEHVDSANIAHLLDKQYRIAVRAGFHCTPLSHQTQGTLSTGAVRASLGYFNTAEEVDQFVEAVREIGAHYRRK